MDRARGPQQVSHTRLSHCTELERHFELGAVLGRGCFGAVVEARCPSTGSLWAVKVLHKSSSVTRTKCLERELQILKRVQHPHIIRLEKVFDSPQTLYLVFERCNAELARVLRQERHFCEADTRTILHRLSSAVAYLHRHDIVHRDLKLENIVVSTNPDPACAGDRLYIKVADFGLSTVREGSATAGDGGMLFDSCGTLPYMAPELVEERLYSQLCDVWAMGVIMFLLLSGRFPFTTSDAIRHQDPCFSGWPAPASGAAVSLIRKMLSKNPAFRLTAAEVQMHSWIRGEDDSSVNAWPGNVLDMMRSWNSELQVNAQPIVAIERVHGQGMLSTD